MLLSRTSKSGEKKKSSSPPPKKVAFDFKQEILARIIAWELNR